MWQRNSLLGKKTKQNPEAKPKQNPKDFNIYSYASEHLINIEAQTHKEI